MKTKFTVVGLALVLVLLGAPLTGYAQCVQDEVELVADGVPRTVPLLFGNETITYYFQVRTGHSYSLQITTPQRQHNPTGLVFNAPLVHCGGPQGTATDTSFTDPALLNDGSNVWSGRRISFIPTTSGGVGFNFTNTAPEPCGGCGNRSFDAVLVDTTLFNPAWSTFGTFETFYSCTNTTNNGTLDATLKIFNTAGTEVGSFTFTDIPAGGTVSRNTDPTSLNVANNLNGSATLTHNGPPGALTCEAAIADFATAPRIVQPVKFEPARQMR